MPHKQDPHLRVFKDTSQMSEFDQGYEAGLTVAAREALWYVNAHIGRLDPGKKSKTRDALLDLEASIRANMLTRRGYTE